MQTKRNSLTKNYVGPINSGPDLQDLIISFFVMIFNPEHREHPYRSLMQQQFKISMKLTDLKTLKKLNMDINYSLSEDSFKNISEKN